MTREKVFITLSIILILVTFLLSFDNLCRYRYDTYMAAYDNATHLANMRGFYKQGIFSSENYWLYAPSVFPLNYPPLFHIIGAILFSFFSPGFISCFYFWSIYLMVLLTVFFMAKKITDSAGAFFTVLGMICLYELADKSFGFSPLVLSVVFGLWALITVRQRPLWGWAFLALAILTHLNGILFLLGYGAYAVYDRSHRQEVGAALGRGPHRRVRIVGVITILSVTALIAGFIILQRAELVHSLIPADQVIPILLRPVTIFFGPFDIRRILFAALGWAGFIMLLRKKDYLSVISLGAIVIGSLIIGGTIRTLNMMIVQGLLIGVVFFSFFLKLNSIHKHTVLNSLIVSLGVCGMVAFPSSRDPYRSVLSEITFVNFCLPSVSIYTGSHFPHLNDFKEAARLMTNMGKKDDLVYVAGVADNQRNLIFAFSGIVPLAVDRKMYPSISGATALFTERFLSNSLPLFWFGPPPPYGYELLKTFPEGLSLFVLARKEKARTLSFKVLR
ncbi:MAG: hypothetical protein JXD21_00940 [Candidatus Omnitrophica bacterium]|nr:hypothetical protein [Candidatus Omnitrophota bacterium]